jgi:hypothetical protein
MNIEVNDKERDVLKKAVESYLSETRLEVRETKGDKSGLHEEENLLRGILKKLS